MPENVKTRAIVVGSMPYGESDLIVTFLSETEGLLKGFAKGALRSRKRFSGTFEPFTMVELRCRLKDSALLARVESADVLDAHYGIREDLDRIGAGSVVLELAAKMEMPGAGSREAFSLLETTLGLMEKSADPYSLGAAFFVKYAATTGYGVPFNSCAACGKRLGKGEEAPAAYAGAAGILCPSCAGPGRESPISPGTLAFMRRAAGMDAGMMARLRCSRAVKTEMYGFIKSYAKTVMGATLKSLKVNNPTSLS